MGHTMGLLADTWLFMHAIVLVFPVELFFAGRAKMLVIKHSSQAWSMGEIARKFQRLLVGWISAKRYVLVLSLQKYLFEDKSNEK